MSQTTQQTPKNKQTKRGRPTAQRPRTALVVALGLIAVAVIAGVVLIATNLSGGASGVALRDTENAFSVPTLVGQAAPAFTATGADGVAITVKPGDGRAKVLVFYMGYR